MIERILSNIKDPQSLLIAVIIVAAVGGWATIETLLWVLGKLTA